MFPPHPIIWNFHSHHQAPPRRIQRKVFLEGFHTVQDGRRGDVTGRGYEIRRTKSLRETIKTKCYTLLIIIKPKLHFAAPSLSPSHLSNYSTACNFNRVHSLPQSLQFIFTYIHIIIYIYIYTGYPCTLSP